MSHLTSMNTGNKSKNTCRYISNVSVCFMSEGLYILFVLVFCVSAEV